MGDTHFSTILHLAGEQPLPLYIGMLQFDCPRHVLAVTEKTRAVGQTLQRIMASGGRTVELVEVPAYDTGAAIAAFDRQFARGGQDVALNLTGGTKPMFAAGYQAAFSKGLPMFYVETTGGTLDWLGAQPHKEPLQPVMHQVATFVELAGYGFKLPALPAPEVALIEACWQHRAVLGRWQRSVADYGRYPGVPFKEGPRKVDNVQVFAQLEGPDRHYHGTLEIGHFKHAQANWPELARFIAGGWFEYFVARQVDKLKQNGKILDACLNVFVEMPATAAGGGARLQELDVAFTDGFNLTILECKAGAIDQDHVQKLENLARLLGGHFGRGILVSAFEPDNATRRRIAASSSVSAICQNAIQEHPESLLSIRAGQVLGVGRGGPHHQVRGS